jgi:alkylation response protein AidB-like acyl-CoA dehydrogenase
VDFELDAEQQELRDGFRRLLSERCNHTTLRAAISLPGAIDRVLWAQLAETGVFSLRLPHEAGGLGAGMAEAVVVAEEVGRAAVPGPVIASSLLAPYVDGAAGGTVVVTAAYPSERDQLVEHLDGVDFVAFVSPLAIRLARPSELDATAERASLDPLTPVHVVRAAMSEGTSLVAPYEAARLWLDGTLLSAATQVGLAAAALDLATSYAKQRKQFGRPIGSFQAVKHLLANALAATEVARAGVQAAAVRSDEQAPDPEVGRVVGAARVLASRAARRSTRAAIQVHGGMGYTWEIDAQLFLKRAMVLDTHFDSPARARDRLLAALSDA